MYGGDALSAVSTCKPGKKSLETCYDHMTFKQGNYSQNWTLGTVDIMDTIATIHTPGVVGLFYNAK